MTIYKLVIAYDGTNYFGWQKQPNVKTIQQTLEDCIKKSLKQRTVKTLASGRTDAGVHAKGQVVKLELSVDIEPENLQNCLDKNLPPSIQVLSLERSEEFHPILDAKSKVYRYYFSKQRLLPLDGRGILTINESIDSNLMNEAAKLFVGEKSFHNYFCVGTPVKSFVREIYRCSIEKEEIKGLYGTKIDLYFLEISGNGFLKQMVRLIFDALIQVGLGKINQETILQSFSLDSDGKISKVAPAKGLTLYEVFY